MTLRMTIGFIVLVSATVLLRADAADAADAYLCGPDKVVYVAVEDLEKAKRTDPCIAGYFGLTLEAKKTESATATPVAAPTPVPSAKKVAAAIAQAAAPDLRALTASEVPDKAPRLERQASLSTPLRSAPGTDFRNVRVLNAQSPDSAWFRHDR